MNRFLKFRPSRFLKPGRSLLLLLLLCFHAPAFADLNTGLVAYWSFDDCTANDKSGKGNNGTKYGTQCVQGQIGKALQFDGASYITVPSSTSLNPVNQLTISLWVRADVLSNAAIIGKGLTHWDGCGADREYGIWLGQDISHPDFFHVTSSGDNNCQQWLNSNSPITIGKWLHIVNVIDRVNHLTKFYIDGQLKTQQPDSYNSFNNSNFDLLIGRMDAQPNEPYYAPPLKGAIDEVRIYNRALTATEVGALYQQGTKPIKNGVSSNTNICATNLNWCASPIFNVLGMVSTSDIPINLINTSYIVDGLTRTLSNGTATITANLYNRGYADAMLDVYDKQGYWTGFIVVKGNRPETTVGGDMWDKWITTYDSYGDAYSVFDPRDAAGVEKTVVNFAIPRGGYAVISKNSTTAIANTVLNNSLDILGEKDWLNNEKGSVKVKLIKIFAEEVAKSSLNGLNNQLKDAISKNNSVEASSITTEMLKELSMISFKVFVTDGDKLIKVFGKDVLAKKAAKRFAKKAAKYFSAVGELIGGAETFATGLSITGQWIDIAKANDGRAVYFK